MTINNSPILKPEELKDALSNARDLINGINPKWLEKQKALNDLKFVKHIRFPNPLTIKLDGRSSHALITKPGS